MEIKFLWQFPCVCFYSPWLLCAVLSKPEWTDSVCTLTHTQSLLLRIWALSVNCPLTGAILPVFTHLPPLPLPTVPSTVPCNPEAQCLAANLTTHWTATCCAQGPSPPLFHPRPHPAPNQKTNPPRHATLAHQPLALLLTTSSLAPYCWDTTVLLWTIYIGIIFFLCKTRLTVPICLLFE